jgi:large subunit ribosomal protein L13
MGNLKLTRETYVARPRDIERKWYLVDAEGQPMGRLASRLATILRGKHKPVYTPNIDTGDFVVVVNVEKMILTGDKENKKRYYHHSGYPGGLKETRYKDLFEKRPEQVLLRAVRGMLPKNRLGRSMLKKLHVYSGGEHPHGAQKPESLDLD